MGRRASGDGLLNQSNRVLSHAWLCRDDAVVGFVALDSFFVGEAKGSKEAEDDEGSPKRALEETMLIRKGRHRGPVIIDVGHAVSFQHVAIAGSHESRVANLRGVLWTARQRAEKTVERIQKRGGLRAPSLELKDERPELGPEPFLRRREQEILKHTDIQEAWIGFPGLGTIAGMLRVSRDGQFLPHFGAEAKVLGHLVGIVGQLFRSGRSIERMIDADRLEQRPTLDDIRRILGERVGTEADFGMCPLIDESLPSLISQ